jgi:hypothetical protein
MADVTVSELMKASDQHHFFRRLRDLTVNDEEIDHDS